MDKQALIRGFLSTHGALNGTQRESLLSVIQAVAHTPWGEGRTVEEVLSTKRVGTCTGKHLVLSACLEALGLPHRTTVCTFHWSEQSIALPKELRGILKESEWVHGHNFLQVQNATGHWVDVDVTWDPPLKPYGFRTFPEDWDGETSFIGLSRLIERFDDAQIEMKKKWIASLTEEQQERRERFLRKFFSWIASLRR
jgi:arylamine N-acetyltransferase